MLKLKIWDVKHGSAAYINTPGDKHFVIDLGTGSFGDFNEEFSPLMHLKDNYGVEFLDEVIITHPHTDHLDDIFNFDSLSPKVLNRPKHLTEEDIRKANPDSDNDIINKYLEINDRYSVPLNESNNPGLPENNGGVSFKHYTPKECGRSNINNHSVVTIIEYLGVKILIPGDNESPSWDELLNNDGFLSDINGTNIYVASHHGRESGYSSELFKHIEPCLVIVSDDKETDTSITRKYSEKASGWTVNSRKDDSSEMRYCLTTRKDGMIEITVYKDDENKYLVVNKE